MNSQQKVKIFLVDDDALFLKSLAIEFHGREEIEVETFASGELCLLSIGNKPDVIVLDYHLNGIDADAMNGIETLDRIKDFDAGIPVIMLSSQDKINVAVDCMHHYAFDYVVKSETAFMRLQNILTMAINVRKMERQLHWYMERM